MGKAKTKTKKEKELELPPDSELLSNGQMTLFKDDVLVLAEKFEALKVRQSRVADELKGCDAALMIAMKSAGITEGVADLKDGEKVEYRIEEVLKRKKIVAK